MSSSPYYESRNGYIRNCVVFPTMELSSFCSKRNWEVEVSPFDLEMNFTITITGKTRTPKEVAVLPYLREYPAFWEIEAETTSKTLILRFVTKEPERLLPLEDELKKAMFDSPLYHLFIDYCREEKPYVRHSFEELVWKALTMPPSWEFPLDSRLRAIALENYNHLTGREVNYNNLWSRS